MPEMNIEQQINAASRFKKNNTNNGRPRIGVVVAIRGAESFDRYTVLKQGDYNTGKYGNQYDCGVYSPFMDLSTEDLWKVTTLCDLDANEIYSMFWDAGVPLANMRIGSPLNEYAGDSVKLYKVLNPDTYGKMVGRLDGVDFVSSYGGVFNNGFKYIKLDQEKPFFQGCVTSESLAKAINYIGAEYYIRDNKLSINDPRLTKVNNATDSPVKPGDNIKMKKIHDKFIRLEAADKAMANGDEELANYFKANIPKLKTWYDYCKQLVNNAEPMFAKSWKPKFETSIRHWSHAGSAVNEATVDCFRILSNRVNKDFGYDQLDYDEYLHWAECGYTDISRMPILKEFRYNQDCAENLVRYYLEDIKNNWDNGGKEEFENNKYLYGIFFAPDGKNKSYIRKYIHTPIAFIEGSCVPSAKDIRLTILGHKTLNIKEVPGFDANNYDPSSLTDTEKYNKAFWNAWKYFSMKYCHDQVRESANFKRCVIACLRSDIKLTYLGFSQSAEERAIRANAEAAFAQNEEERQKKIKEYERLKKQAENEKEEANKD